MIVVDKQPRLEHNVMIPQTSAVEIARMCAWCHAQFGKRFSITDRPTFGRDGTWHCTYDGFSDRPSAYKFSFDYEQDAMLFALRWT
jgi:hypothetical protein